MCEITVTSTLFPAERPASRINVTLTSLNALKSNRVDICCAPVLTLEISLWKISVPLETTEYLMNSLSPVVVFFATICNSEAVSTVGSYTTASFWLMDPRTSCVQLVDTL